jgi:hypothetical protein
VISACTAAAVTMLPNEDSAREALRA